MNTESIKSSIKNALASLYVKDGIGALKDKIEVSGSDTTLEAEKIYVKGVDVEIRTPADNSITADDIQEDLDLGFIPTIITTEGGRRLYRHDSGMGTVIEFNDGILRKVLVLDAKYRENSIQLSDDTTTDLPLTNYSASNNKNNSYLNGSSNLNTNSSYNITDETLNSLWWTDDYTSRINTDAWLRKSDGSPAATFCRNIEVEGTPCDLPNFQTLQRIYCEAIHLDQLDPTVTEFSNLKATKLFASSRVWSSTECDAQYAWSISYNGNCGRFLPVNNGYGVFPVLEL